MKRFLNRLMLIKGGLLIAYLALIRPWISRWNATQDEVEGVHPGDELIPEPLLQTTRSVLIRAPAETVWPWLVQIGYGRAGFYAVDALVQPEGLKAPDAPAKIHPAFQHLNPGDTIAVGPVTPMTVAVLRPNRALVLHGLIDLKSGQALDPRHLTMPWVDWTWSLTIVPLNDYACRLVSRVRAVYAPYALLWPLVALGLEPAAFAIDRKMLQSIRQLVEKE